MSRKKKNYENVFAKMAEHHNNIVPLIRSLNLSSIKIRNRRILQLKDVLETSEDLMLSIDLFTEYLVTNSFILGFMDQSNLDDCYNLIKTKEKSNCFIGINTLYSLIEDKKKEIIDKMKSDG